MKKSLKLPKILLIATILGAGIGSCLILELSGINDYISKTRLNLVGELYIQIGGRHPYDVFVQDCKRIGGREMKVITGGKTAICTR